MNEVWLRSLWAQLACKRLCWPRPSLLLHTLHFQHSSEPS
jgi:hypothetical protein